MKQKLFPAILLIAYIGLIVKVLILKDIPALHFGYVTLDFSGTHDGPANWTPLKTIIPYLLASGGWLIGGMNIIGNIVLLVPLGFLIPFVFTRTNWKQIIVVSILSSFLIEGIQAILHIGIFDIDDVILNAIGIMIGYWKNTIWPKFLVFVKKHKILISIVTLVMVASIYFGYKSLIKGLPPLKREMLKKNKCCDLCGGTGGTGKIISIERNNFTIKRKDSVQQIIKVTNKTAYKTSNGLASFKDLKIGNHVTLIIDESETASLVLVCQDLTSP
ncbi:MAG: VanZ family protein [Bacteroidota bacterium]